jgi:hypothetical protein
MDLWVAWLTVSCGASSSGSQTSTYPVLLEALLGAKVAILDPESETFGTLQRGGLVLAAGAEALALRWGFFGHGGSVKRDGSRKGFDECPLRVAECEIIEQIAYQRIQQEVVRW